MPAPSHPVSTSGTSSCLFFQPESPALTRLTFRQNFDPASSTCTCLLADRDSREAVLVDPVCKQARRDLALLTEPDLKLATTCETHMHADHAKPAGY